MKIGIVGYSQDTLDLLKLNKKSLKLKVVGIYTRNKQEFISPKDNIKYYSDFNKLLDNSDVIFFIDNDSDFLDLATKSIQQSKHIFIYNINNLTKENTNSLFKLSSEAKTNIQIKKTSFFNPIFQNSRKHIDNPKLIEIHRKNESSIKYSYQNLLSDIGIINSCINSSIKKLNTITIPSSKTINSLFISFEFDNKSIATITTNSISNKNNVSVNFFQTEKNITLDYNRKTCNLFTTNGCKTIKESLRNKTEKSEILELKNFIHNCKNTELNNTLSNTYEQNLILLFLEVNKRLNY